ncbi:MAG: integrase [Comamonas sp. SCN 67-35]|uniref:site-specific integrase n=1 Tax=unclassified Comamonas TaxID=2638500 RepID=UPI00086BB6C9|nr:MULTISPECIES: site-specific integrase [unclassified Comamonas]MBN9330757.1 site-specific integrase [Comamonas sp.]ODU39993.1 MAG: integrase [Comamonas sp. SCN 67-35]OJW98055.1 MAG: integrase [Burkholderiales bacterium 66-26]
MATINKRGLYQYQAIVRRAGYPTQCKTFEAKRDAQDWASTVESEMRRGVFVDRTEAERMTLGQLLERYRDKVTPLKRGEAPERSRLKRLIAHPIALQRLARLRAVDFSDYRDERLDEGASNKTVREELLLLSAVLNTASKEWSIPVENWVCHLRKPAAGKHRERRPSADEEQKLMTACKESKSEGLEFAVVLAIETGMRRGELAGLTWAQVDFSNSVVRLVQTKNGEGRIVPLSVKAEEALRALRVPSRATNCKIFSFYDSNGLGAAFTRACRRAGIQDLHFHDLRHEAASRFAPRMAAPSLAKIMGWKTLQMAMRYYNPREAELVALVRAAA